jgi:hypothetical protein
MLPMIPATDAMLMILPWGKSTSQKLLQALIIQDG